MNSQSEISRKITKIRYSVCQQHGDGTFGIIGIRETLDQARSEAKFAADTLKRKIFIQKVETVEIIQETILENYGN